MLHPCADSGRGRACAAMRCARRDGRLTRKTFPVRVVREVLRVRPRPVHARYAPGTHTLGRAEAPLCAACAAPLCRRRRKSWILSRKSPWQCARLRSPISQSLCRCSVHACARARAHSHACFPWTHSDAHVRAHARGVRARRLASAHAPSATRRRPVGRCPTSILTSTSLCAGALLPTIFSSSSTAGVHVLCLGAHAHTHTHMHARLRRASARVPCAASVRHSR